MPSLAVPLYVAPGDYTAISPPQNVTFSSAPSQMCVPVSISIDNVVEAEEFFTVILESTDRAVQFTLPITSVTISDSTSTYLLSVCSIIKIIVTHSTASKHAAVCSCSYVASFGPPSH